MLIGVLAVGWPGFANGAAKKKRSALSTQELPARGEKVLWRDPADIEERDLIHGQGGVQHQPAADGFKFTKEEVDGTNPKFTVRDRSGAKWKVKLGDEARPETVATRLVWAAGFYTDEDYLIPLLRVNGLPTRLRRGAEYVSPDGTMLNARLEREIPGEKKVGIWKWSDDPFTGTREWNGLRVLMSLINNWDVKDVNNGIYQVGKGDAKEYVYAVTDLGASFGPARLDLGRKKDKGDFTKYRASKFVRRVLPETVDFECPGVPSPIYLLSPVTYIHRRHLAWIGRDVPREDARWMGTVLSRLSHRQIRDAFRAGGYSPAEVEAFAGIVEKRIASLSEL
jgi:hypothetical protein